MKPIYQYPDNLMDVNKDIEELYDKYARNLFFTSLRIVGNSFDAEEIMQDAFIQYYKHSCKTEIKKTESWLKSVCIRRSIDVLRSKNRNRDFLEELKEEETHSYIFENEGEQETVGTGGRNTGNSFLKVEAIRSALRSLPDGYRTILSLSLFEGYDHAEIAEILKVKEGTIRSQYIRGKARLLQLLEREKIKVASRQSS